VDDETPEEAIAGLVESLLAQTRVHIEIIACDRRSEKGPIPGDDEMGRVKAVRGKWKTRSAAINAGLKKAKGKNFLLIDNQGVGLTVKKSCAETMAMSLRRESGVAMVYSDYERREGGKTTDVKLLSHHPGRLRDFQDFGRVWMTSSRELKRIGGLDSRLRAGDLYDLRLKLSEKGEVRHISNRYAGSLYTVEAAGAGHDVFAYLLASKETQLEVEKVLSGHLRRIGANLRPGAHCQRVKYTKKESARFKDCLVTVVVPVNSRPEFIDPAVESIQAQSDKRVEAIIVVNGGEKDPTCAAVREYMEGGSKYDPAASTRPGASTTFSSTPTISSSRTLWRRSSKSSRAIPRSAWSSAPTRCGRRRRTAASSSVRTSQLSPTTSGLRRTDATISFASTAPVPRGRSTAKCFSRWEDSAATTSMARATMARTTTSSCA
jgi:hypothetical protein